METPKNRRPRIEVEQMNHIFSFCTGLASPMVSHIYGYPLPIRMGIKHQKSPEVSLRLWMVAAVIVFISPIIALHEYTSGGHETWGRKSTEPMDLLWAALTGTLLTFTFLDDCEI